MRRIELKLMIYFGFHGISHRNKEKQVLQYMHDNGIGA